jgi:hypothetical protein
MAKKTIIKGTSKADPDLHGTIGVDIIHALNGDDIITGLSGNDTIDGGRGNDTAVFSGPANGFAADSYSFDWLANGALRVTGTDGVDTLRGIEFLTIGDQTYSSSGPVARSDTGSGSENDTMTIGVLANDVSLKTGATLKIQKLGGGDAAVGDTVATVDGIEVKLGDNNSLVIDPGTTWDSLDAGEIIHRTFDYTVGNGTGEFATAPVDLTITGTSEPEPGFAYSVQIVDPKGLAISQHDALLSNVNAALVDWARYISGSGSIEIDLVITEERGPFGEIVTASSGPNAGRSGSGTVSTSSGTA